MHSGVVEAASAVGSVYVKEVARYPWASAEAAAEGPAAAREARSKKPRQGSCKRAGVEAEHASIRGTTPQAPGMRGAEPARGRPLVQGGGEVRGLAAAVAVAAQRDLPEADEHGHLLAQAGPITFCVACGSYAMHVAQGLKGACQGRPTSKSNTDVLRRKKRARLLAGEHPVTKEKLGGLSASDLARWQGWSKRLDEEQPTMGSNSVQEAREPLPTAAGKGGGKRKKARTTAAA